MIKEGYIFLNFFKKLSIVKDKKDTESFQS